MPRIDSRLRLLAALAVLGAATAGLTYHALGQHAALQRARAEIRLRHLVGAGAVSMAMTRDQAGVYPSIDCGFVPETDEASCRTSGPIALPFPPAPAPGDHLLGAPDPHFSTLFTVAAWSARPDLVCIGRYSLQADSATWVRLPTQYCGSTADVAATGYLRDFPALLARANLSLAAR